MTTKFDFMPAIAEVRDRLMRAPPDTEEMQLLKTKLDVLTALRAMGGQHDDDIDEAGHHHHEHFSN